MLLKYFYTLLISIGCLHVGAQTLKQPVILIDPQSYTLIDSLQKLDVPPVSKPAVPISSSEACRCYAGCSTLPVTLLSFTGERINNENVLLRWETTNELQNKGFEVERSLGMPTSFNTIAFVAAQQNIGLKKKYTLNDPNNFDGISYYRLKQIDQDNNFTFSNIVAVKGFTLKASLKLYPNPAAANINISIYFAKSGNAKLWIMDAAQKILLVKNIACTKGNNLIAIPVKSFSAGIYFIKIINNDNVTLNGNFTKL